MKSLTLIISLVFVMSSVYSQRLLKNLKNAHNGKVVCMSLTADGNKLVTGGEDGRVYFWNTRAGKKEKTTLSHTGVKDVDINYSNKLVATAGAKRLYVWNLEDGKPKNIYQGTDIISVACSPIDDSKVIGEADGSIVVLDEKSKEITKLNGHSMGVTSLVYSPDGKMLASAGADNIVNIWNLESFGVENTITLTGKGVTALCFSADAAFLAVADADGTVGLWNPSNASKLSDFEGLKHASSVSFSPDVQYIAAAGNDNKIIIWETELQQVSKTIDAHTTGIVEVAFSEKDNILSSIGNDGAVSVWDTKALGIGKKRTATGAMAPVLACSPLNLYEREENGIIESTDNARIEFIIKNEGEGVAFDVVVNVGLSEEIEGLFFDREVYVGNLAPGKSQRVDIAVSPSPEMATATGTFKISVSEANGNNAEAQTLDFQTKGGNIAFIMVKDVKYTSATGKAEKGSPITLKLVVQNATNTDAKGIKVQYLLPENIIAVDKMFEVIDFKPNELKEISMQFQTTDKFDKEEIKLNLNIEGAANTNVSDVDIIVAMNQELPVTTDSYIAEHSGGGEAIMRGGSDPLKGLNVSAAKKEMEIGSYYALIIGVDKYRGDWTSLNNAVRDAKAVEELLKSKYRFDHFRALYDEQATRENIIKELEWLTTNVKEKDNVFIYYSGHGDYKENLSKGFWVPYDAVTFSVSKYISNSDIQTFLGGINSSHTLLISDACFSGDIFRGKTVSVPFENSEKYYQRVNSLMSRQAITSGGIEPVMDGGRDGHSVFAYYLLKTLRNNQYKYFDANQIYSKIKIPVVNNSQQDPKFQAVSETGDEGGQFIFIKR